jgi:hypothetical protein
MLAAPIVLLVSTVGPAASREELPSPGRLESQIGELVRAPDRRVRVRVRYEGEPGPRLARVGVRLDVVYLDAAPPRDARAEEEALVALVAGLLEDLHPALTLSPASRVRVRFAGRPGRRAHGPRDAHPRRPPPPPPALLVELPSADVLGEADEGLEVRALRRQTRAGIYDNLSRGQFTAVDVRWRRGIASGAEVALGGSLGDLSATPVTTPFGEPTPGMASLSAAVKFVVPDEVLGTRIAFGAGGSLVDRRDRALLAADDSARLSPVYVVLARRVGDHVRGSLVFRRSRVLASRGNAGTNLTTFDAAIEIARPGWPGVQLEILDERLSIRAIGDFGRSVGYDGITVNLGVRALVAEGVAASAAVRRVNRPENIEVVVGSAWRI